MRTTVAINDHLLEEAKRAAGERGQTLGTLIEEALRRELAYAAVDLPLPELPVFTGGTGVRPGIEINSNRQVQEVLDKDLPLEKLR